MESKNDEENREAAKSMPITRAKANPPTRLQKRAPAALQLDQISISSSNIDETEDSSYSAIPLLSPLILSPLPLQQQGEGEEKDHQQQGSIGAAQSSTGGGGGGWQHPAVVEAFPDASMLFDFFQSQCVLVNRVQ